MYESHQIYLIAIVILLIYATASVFYCVFLVRAKKEKEENQIKFFNSIKQGITYGWIGDLEDIKRIYDGMEGQREDLEVLIRRFVFHYLVNFRRPLEDQSTAEIKNKVDNILGQLDLSGQRDFLLEEDRIMLDSLRKAVGGGKDSTVQDKLTDLAHLLSEKNHRAVTVPTAPTNRLGLVSFGAATAVSLVLVLMVAVLG
ncbi:MAG: hypothetical protein KQI62_10615 [Deltaproteobacteria bacterium]|nr:hypothetical protein [Deltaproteobacteria bacterium]